MIIDEKPKKTGRYASRAKVQPRRTDGWMNLLSGMGRDKSDKRTGTFFSGHTFLSDEELTQLYLGDGIAKKIVTRAADDMTRAWIKIRGEDEGLLQARLTSIGLQNKLNYALRMARLYRGAVLLMVTDEGIAQDLSAPISATADIVDLRVYSASRISISEGQSTSSFSDDIEIFPIRKRNGGTMWVHTSRLLLFRGDPAPDYLGNFLSVDYRFWGLPVLLSVYSKLQEFAGMEGGISQIMTEYSIGKYTLANLIEVLRGNDREGIKKFYDRLDAIDYAKSTHQAIYMGEGESYTRDTASLSGVKDVFSTWQDIIAMVSDYPSAILWGKSPAGQNSTGTFDLRSYYDSIKSKQDVWIKQPLQNLVDKISSGMRLKGEHVVTFPSVWEPTEEERISIEKTRADILSVKVAALRSLVEIGALGEGEILAGVKSLFPELDIDV